MVNRAKAIVGHSCRHCFHHTEPGRPYCGPCYFRLPKPMREALSRNLRRTPSRLSKAISTKLFFEADGWLKATTPHLWPDS